MSTVYYICRKQDYERSIAIKEYVGAASNFIVLATTLLALLKGQNKNGKHVSSKE